MKTFAIWYRLTTPEKVFLLRVYGQHKLAVTTNGMTTTYYHEQKKPIVMTLPFAMSIVRKLSPLHYYKHYTRCCKLEIIERGDTP